MKKNQSVFPHGVCRFAVAAILCAVSLGAFAGRTIYIHPSAVNHMTNTWNACSFFNSHNPKVYSNLKDSELAKIEAVAQHLQANPTRVVMVEGNCDERGSNEYNITLGELRAGSVRDYLLRLGIAAERVQTKSFGEEKPAVAGSGESVWAKNRRGEFAIYQHK